MKSGVLWAVTPWSLERDRHFGRACRLHLQGRSVLVNQARNKQKMRLVIVTAVTQHSVSELEKFVPRRLIIIHSPAFPKTKKFPSKKRKLHVDAILKVEEYSWFPIDLAKISPLKLSPPFVRCSRVRNLIWTAITRNTCNVDMMGDIFFGFFVMGTKFILFFCVRGLGHSLLRLLRETSFQGLPCNHLPLCL
jgi:hypothetical protein